MVKSREIPTITSVQDLSGVTFGHKFPRLGLKLLHWLAKEWIVFDRERRMLAKTNPSTGGFGFHIFHNKDQILPSIPRDRSCYFEVGNLCRDGSNDLPFRKANIRSNENNIDRVIVRIDSGQVVGVVYITEHTPHQNSFSSESTYRISRGLIWHIQGLKESVFLQQAGYIPGTYEYPMTKNRETNMEEGDMKGGFPRQSRSTSSDICSCVIL